jgi:ABC-type histidine transport system ATPase subunit
MNKQDAHLPTKPIDQLVVDNLHLQYGDNPILKGVSMTLNPGEDVGSWVGTGANMPISGAQLQEILGSGSIGEIAQRLGLSHADASSGLAQVLPRSSTS